MGNHCTLCGQKLKPGTEAWLELDTRTQTYTSKPLPEEFSQGAFPFGKACAKKAEAEHKCATT